MEVLPVPMLPVFNWGAAARRGRLAPPWGRRRGERREADARPERAMLFSLCVFFAASLRRVLGVELDRVVLVHRDASLLGELHEFVELRVDRDCHVICLSLLESRCFFAVLLKLFLPCLHGKRRKVTRFPKI